MGVEDNADGEKMPASASVPDALPEFLMQMAPLFGAEEKQALSDYMDEGGFLTEFKKTRGLEEMIEEFCNVKHCIMVNNGTISLTLASLGCGLEAGDEVIVPNYTMIATPNSQLMFGGQIVFCDVEPDSLYLDIDKARSLINPGKTKAMIVMTANGRYAPAKMGGIDAFVQLCEEHNIALIEDAAQGLGSYYPDGRHLGTVGKCGSFSFSAPKIISTGQGGCVVTNDDTIAKRIRLKKDFGRAEGGGDVHIAIGFNCKFTELQAVVGIEQMKKLPGRVKRKKEIAQLYRDELADCPGMQLFWNDLQFTTPWFIDMQVTPPGSLKKRDELAAYLKKNNIGSRVMYPPIHLQQCFQETPGRQPPGTHPVSEEIGKTGLWLPSSIQTTDEEIKATCAHVRWFLANYSE